MGSFFGKQIEESIKFAQRIANHSRAAAAVGEEAGLERVRRWRSQAIGEDIDRQLDADDEWPESPQAG